MSKDRGNSEGRLFSPYRRWELIVFLVSCLFGLASEPKVYDYRECEEEGATKATPWIDVSCGLDSKVLALQPYLGIEARCLIDVGRRLFNQSVLEARNLPWY
jgi:hypothetical protein